MRKKQELVNGLRHMLRSMEETKKEKERLCAVSVRCYVEQVGSNHHQEAKDSLLRAAERAGEANALVTPINQAAYLLME